MTARSATSWCGSSTPRPSRRRPACAPTSTGTVDQYQPVADFITVAPELQRGQDVPFTLSYPLRSADQPSLNIDQPGHLPGAGQRQRHPRLRRTRPPRRRPLPAAGARRAAGPDDRRRRCRCPRVVPPDTSQPVRDDHAVAAGRPAAAGRGRARRHHSGAAESTTTWRPRWPPAAGSTRCCPPSTSPPARRSTPAAQVRSALCLAVDPDLLVTVNAMTGGYVVNDAPDGGADAPTHPGTGQDAAIDWLEPAQGAGPAHVRDADARTRRPTSTRWQRVGDPGLSAIADQRRRPTSSTRSSASPRPAAPPCSATGR